MRLQVVSVVVTRRQGVGPHQDPALYFRAKALGARALVQVSEVLGVFAAMAEAHTVKTRQVGRGLGRCDDVVRRNRVLHVRQADRLDHGAEFFQFLDAVVDQLGDTRVEAFAEELFRHADTQAIQRTIEVGAEVRYGFVNAGGVLRVETGHALQQDGAVFGRASQRAGLVEAGGVGDHAPARNATVRRFQACEVGQGCRLSDRSASVGPRRGRQQAGGNGGGRTTRRTAGYVVKVPRVFDRAVVARFVGRTHGELVHVGLAQAYGAGSGQLGYHCGVVRCLEVVEHLRGAAGAYAQGAEQVLVSDRGAQQGTAFTVGATCVSGLGLLQGKVFGEGDKTVELRIELGDTRQQGLGQLFGRKLFIGESAGDLGQSQLMHAGAFPLLDDFRNQIEAVFDRWCDGLISLAMIAFSHDVGTQALAGFQWVGQRLDTGSVDGLHLINQPQNAVKGFGGAWNIGIIEAKTGQMCDFFHVGAV